MKGFVEEIAKRLDIQRKELIEKDIHKQVIM